MIFRQLFDATSSTYTYLIADPTTRKAALIDPVLENVERDLQLLRDLDLTLDYVFDTHVHADHVTGAGALRANTGATTVASNMGAPCVDQQVKDGDTIQVGALQVKILNTPGHTDDSISYLVEDRVFTGDALLIRGCGRTDFQNGDSAALYASITKILFALPKETLVFPGHDYRGHTVSTIAEEQRLNPRIAGKSVAEFIEIMDNLNLPAPAKINEAVPANRACGNSPPLQG